MPDIAHIPPRKGTLAEATPTGRRAPSFAGEMAPLFGVLGHPVAVAIVSALPEGRERSVLELSAYLDAHPSDVAEQVGALVSHGALVVRDSRRPLRYRVKHRYVFQILNLATEIAETAQDRAESDPEAR